LKFKTKSQTRNWFSFAFSECRAGLKKIIGCDDEQSSEPCSNKAQGSWRTECSNVAFRDFPAQIHRRIVL
jgi:hypothetical protein